MQEEKKKKSKLMRRKKEEGGQEVKGKRKRETQGRGSWELPQHRLALTIEG